MIDRGELSVSEPTAHNKKPAEAASTGAPARVSR
jgi:hypothetical protein